MDCEEGQIIIITTDENDVLDVTGEEGIPLVATYDTYGDEDDDDVEEQVIMVTPSTEEIAPTDGDMKRRRSTYSVNKKLEILKKYETIYKRNARRTERETGVPRKCIQRWLQQRDKIEELAKSYYDEYGNEVRSYTVRESRAVFPELEAELAGIVSSKHGLTRSEVSRLAMDIFPTIYPTKDPSCFKASKHWFNNFMQRLKDGMDYVSRPEVTEEGGDLRPEQRMEEEDDDETESPTYPIAIHYSSNDEIDIKVDVTNQTQDVTPADVLDSSSAPVQDTSTPVQDNTKKEPGAKDDTAARRCRSTYSLPFKHSVIQKFYSEFGQSITRTSKALDIPRKCIHRWVQQQGKIESLLQINSNPEDGTQEHKFAVRLTVKKDTPVPTGVTCYVKEKQLQKQAKSATTSDAKDVPNTTEQDPNAESSSVPVKKVRAMYSLELKKETIEKYDKLYNCSIRRTARETGIPRKCVQRWVRQRDKIHELVNAEGGTRTCKVKVYTPRKRNVKEEDFSNLENSAAGLRKRRRYFEERMLPIPPELDALESTEDDNEGKIIILEEADAFVQADENSRTQPCASPVILELPSSTANPVVLETSSFEEVKTAESEQSEKMDDSMEQVENGEDIITVLPSDLMETPNRITGNVEPPPKEPSITRRNRSSYSLSTKLRALDKYFNVYGQNCRKTAREMEIPRKCVQRWVQQRDKIQEWSQIKEHGNLKKLFTFRGRKPEYPELEKELTSVLRELSELGESFTVKQLGEKAKSLFLRLYPDRDPGAFKASNHWVRNFLKRAQEEAAVSGEYATRRCDSPNGDAYSPSENKMAFIGRVETKAVDEIEVVNSEDVYLKRKGDRACYDEEDCHQIYVEADGEDPMEGECSDNTYILSGDFTEMKRDGEEDSHASYEEDDSIPSMISMAHMIPLQ